MGAGTDRPRERPAILDKLERRRERYQERGLFFRIVWVIAAFIVLAAGLAMIVFPGPALVVIPLGLAMLSFEFCWAQRLLDKSIEKGLDAKDTATSATPRQKRVGALGVALAAAAIASIALLIVT